MNVNLSPLQYSSYLPSLVPAILLAGLDDLADLADLDGVPNVGDAHRGRVGRGVGVEEESRWEEKMVGEPDKKGARTGLFYTRRLLTLSI